MSGLLGDVPLAGLFAAGELGPVGSKKLPAVPTSHRAGREIR
jgi:small ligand-binding sensory domain FIST